MCSTRGLLHMFETIRGLTTFKWKSPLIKLNPFLDKGGLLRVGGRLDNTFLSFDQKHPISLPKAHYITQLTITCRCTINSISLREKYWIPSGRCLVKQILFKCIKCARFRTKPVQQLMGNLPTSLINWTRPLTKIGIDFYHHRNYYYCRQSQSDTSLPPDTRGIQGGTKRRWSGCSQLVRLQWIFSDRARSVLDLTAALVAAVLVPPYLRGFMQDAELSLVNPQLSPGSGAT
ncbi:hypothetical protein LAZ67_19001475 [Cordylochernes scorpioides]|uniref:Uncharacterized protein n=1 Tax=Cordylochernes scorpioides TaxID=51811 RepID=A0ABY6LJX4_9ARAC|nr:hypothetical protein LAZ67_19001475 [Cordylochernes scorpioides]